MNNKTIFKTWDLMSEEEQKEIKNDDDLLDCFLDRTGSDIDYYDEDEYERYVSDVSDNHYIDDFAYSGNWYYSNLRNVKIEVQGALGLWDGKKKIHPKRFDNLYEAMGACLDNIQTFIISEDRYGNFIIDAYHHDGKNHFILKKVTSKGIRCLHFRKEVWGCED